MLTGADLERATAAVLQTAGWYVRRGAKDETLQAFELDVLGYRFPGGDEESIVVEAKGGRSGFTALWKLLGQKTHLALDRGVILADPTDPLHTRKIQIGRKHDIAIIDQDSDKLAASLGDVGAVEVEAAPDILAMWLRCYRVEDAIIKVLHDKDLWQQYETIKLAKQQLQQLESRVWLEPDPWRQAVRLYLLYQDETKISKTMAEEINGRGARALFLEAIYEGASAEMQGCLYLEHRKRIELSFAAARCAALDADGVLGRTWPLTPSATWSRR
jgi:hypothetical protein